jgi:large subunit ribosomal protein LP2
MRVIAAYLLAVLGGNANPKKEDIKRILDAMKIKSDDANIDKVIKELNGKDLDALIAAGAARLGSAAAVGAPAAGGAAAGGKEKKEEKKEDKKEEAPAEEEEVRAFRWLHSLGPVLIRGFASHSAGRHGLLALRLNQQLHLAFASPVP